MKRRPSSYSILTACQGVGQKSSYHDTCTLTLALAATSFFIMLTFPSFCRQQDKSQQHSPRVNERSAMKSMARPLCLSLDLLTRTEASISGVQPMASS
eukprot:767609-Hanusia_phi.AAC.2